MRIYFKAYREQCPYLENCGDVCNHFEFEKEFEECEIYKKLTTRKLGLIISKSEDSIDDYPKYE